MRHIEGTADMKAPGGASTERRAAGVISGRRVLNVLAIAAVIGVVGLIPATASTSATRGLVAAYGFEEGSGTTVVDSSGGGNDGSIVGAARTRAGLYGSALSFDGSSARVIVRIRRRCTSRTR